MANQKFAGHRVGNHGAGNARAYVQDASRLSPRLLSWLQADPRRVDEFRWKDDVKPTFQDIKISNLKV